MAKNNSFVRAFAVACLEGHVRTDVDAGLEYYALICFLVLGSYYSYLYPKSRYFFSGSTPKQGIPVLLLSIAFLFASLSAEARMLYPKP